MVHLKWPRGVIRGSRQTYPLVRNRIKYVNDNPTTISVKSPVGIYKRHNAHGVTSPGDTLVPKFQLGVLCPGCPQAGPKTGSGYSLGRTCDRTGIPPGQDLLRDWGTLPWAGPVT